MHTKQHDVSKHWKSEYGRLTYFIDGTYYNLFEAIIYLTQEYNMLSHEAVQYICEITKFKNFIEKI